MTLKCLILLKFDIISNEYIYKTSCFRVPFDNMLVLKIIEDFVTILSGLTVVILGFLSSVMFPLLTDKFLSLEDVRNAVHHVDEEFI